MCIGSNKTAAGPDKYLEYDVSPTMIRTKRNTKQNAASGFTLLEVLISVAIIAIAFVTLIGSQSQSVSVADRTRFAVTSALLAQQKLAEIESTDFGEIFSESGDFGDSFKGYEWESEVTELSEEETGIPKSSGMLKAVDLVVRRGGDGGQAYGVRTIIMQKIEAGN